MQPTTTNNKMQKQLVLHMQSMKMIEKKYNINVIVSRHAKNTC